MRSDWLTPAVAASLLGLSPRAFRKACLRAIHGKPWRDAPLIVREVAGRGGRSGRQYEVKVDSLPPEIQARLKGHLKPVEAGANALGATSRLERDLRFHIVSRICAHPKRSQARAKAYEEEAKRPILNPRTGRLERPSVSTLTRWVNRHEQRGEAGLSRLRRTDAGKARAIVTRKFDGAARAAGMDEKTVERIGAELRLYVRGQHKNLVSFAHVRLMGERKLAELAAKAGFPLEALACGLPDNFIKAERVARKVGVFLRDRKKYEDDAPGRGCPGDC